MKNQLLQISPTVILSYFLLFHNVFATPQPVLIKDINTILTSVSSNPTQIINVNGIAYFVATDSANGRELWKSDGTADGTELVIQMVLNTKIIPTLSHHLFRNITNVNDTLFFDFNFQSWKTDGTPTGTVRLENRRGESVITNDITYYVSNGYELWKSNGTNQGTKLIKDFSMEIDDDTDFVYHHLRNLTYINGTLYFSAFTKQNGMELWKSEGTESSTVMVKNIASGVTSSHPDILKNVNGTLLFSAYDGIHGFELWRSDGTDEGTYLVEDMTPGNSSFSPQFKSALYNNLFCFTITSYSIWCSDGTELGTKKITHLHSYIYTIVASNKTLFFTTRDGLWKSDVTEKGTTLLKKTTGYGAVELTDVNDTLFFIVGKGDTSYHELWKSDGTLAGTMKVKDFDHSRNYGSRPGSLTNINGTLFFSAGDSIHGVELWKSDGTTEGTLLVKDINTSAFSNPSPRKLTNYNNTLFFQANRGLWKSDGSNVGTTQVKEFLSIGDLTQSNGLLFFRNSDSINGTELWKSDGTSNGTKLVKDIYLGSDSSYPSHLTNVADELLFVADDGIDGTELWRSDGTSTGTFLRSDIVRGPSSNRFSFGYFTNIEEALYFRANDIERPIGRELSTGRGLWKYDKTNLRKTVLVKKHLSLDSHIHAIENTLFFAASDFGAPGEIDTHGSELWKSDGTSEGTELVKDIRLGVVGGKNSSFPTQLIIVNGILFFRAYEEMNGGELWRSDGTEEGTYLVKDIATGSGSSNPNNLISMNNILYFSATDEKFGRNLWKSDGTESGTILVKDFRISNDLSVSLKPVLTKYSDESPLDYGPQNFVKVNNTLYFSADDGIHGNELWQSDGTEEGTVLVKDIATGIGNSNPDNLILIKHTLFFTANDGEHGTELWGLAHSNPTANEDSFSVNTDNTLNVPAPGLLNNDTDPDGDPLFTVLDSVVTHGSLTLDNNGSFNYTPSQGYSGLDSFTYYATDGELNSEIVTVKLIVKKMESVDFDSDNDMDKDDLVIMKTRFGQNANNADDPYDINKDGIINLLDFRQAIKLCTRLRCATF